jgi:glycosyltransferase involved in cell wall biosynthesis
MGLSLAVVTPTRDRRALLERLFDSLSAQTDVHFHWVVVDDGSIDETVSYITSVQAAPDTPFPIHLLHSRMPAGKAASLNRAFNEHVADFYLIVDSDDQLVPSAVATVRAKARRYAQFEHVGAVFFRYVDPSGALIGKAATGDSVMSRISHDERHGKFDGSVGYYRRAVVRYHYPEFFPETYVGPTVLQLRMHPEFEIVFAPDVVGIAEYQEGGLTAQGRSLRIDNPLGMMEYSALNSAQARMLRWRFKHRVMYFAYRHIARKRGDHATDSAVLAGTATRYDFVSAWLGRLLASCWSRRYGTRRTSPEVRASE